MEEGRRHRHRPMFTNYVLTREPGDERGPEVDLECTTCGRMVRIRLPGEPMSAREAAWCMGWVIEEGSEIRERWRQSRGCGGLEPVSPQRQDRKEREVESVDR